MKKYMRSLYSIIFILIASIGLGACSFGNWHSAKLSSASIAIEEYDRSLSWHKVDEANKYEVFCNKISVKVITESEEFYTYNFENLIKSNLKEYAFYVKAYSNTASSKSNTVKYVFKLQSPGVFLDELDKQLKWNEVYGATSYSIYLNDTLVDTVINDGSAYSYDFSDLINDDDVIYNFYIEARSDILTSKHSNVARFILDSNYVGLNSIDVNNSNLDVITNVRFSGYNLLWDVVKGASDYYVSLFSNSLQNRLFLVDKNTFDFSAYLIEDEVYSFRVGIKQEQQICLSHAVYYNTNSGQEPYTSSYYFFNGKLNDHFINNQQELNNIVYYGFVYKKDEISVEISKSFQDILVAQAGTINSWQHLKVGLSRATSSIVESFDYEVSMKGLDKHNFSKKDFIIVYKFNGGKEPTLSMEKQREQSPLDVPYYDRVNYIERSDSFDDFASDHKIIVEKVETAEQLFHTVQAGATPIIENEESKAYQIYNTAKEVLREIISDEMTDYEKVLSIFDYICVATVYDDDIVSYNEEELSFIAYKSFFLEGVFEEGLAVCDGFSKAFSLMCNMEGVDAFRITGSEHAWNKVKLDDKWYVVDITWSVFKTKADTFIGNGIGEAVNFNSKEFLIHTYFLVSDYEHAKMAANKELNNSMPANENYYYYLNTTYNGVDDFIIDSDAEFIALVKYMLENELLSADVAFSTTYISHSTDMVAHNYDMGVACSLVKSEAGISTANILQIGLAAMLVGEDAGNYIVGNIYSISLINLS